MAFDADEQSRIALNRGAGAYSTPGVDTRVPEKPFAPQTSTPIVHFKFGEVEPPSNLYIRPPDVLQLRASTNITGGDTVTFVIRILRADGTITQEVETIVVAAGWATLNTIPNLPEGYILAASAQSLNATVRGQTWASILLQAKSAPGAQVEEMLFADYVTHVVFPAFPTGRVLNPQEGPGNIRSITGTLPAAGAEISEVVPVRTTWRLIAFRYSLTTAVAAANRETSLQLDDGVNPYVSETAAFTQVASLTFIYSYAIGLQRQAALQSNLITLGSPSVILPAGHRIRTLTANIQAADQYTAPQYLVEEWTTLG